ncbi:MAG: hypothetical protein ACFE0Q_08890 [Anaerolineae bacterium]
MYTFSTVYAMRQYLGLAPDDTAEDARLRDALIVASASIEQHTRRTFQPRLATLTHDINPHDVRALVLKEDLLSLQALTNGDGQAITLGDVVQVASAVLRLTNGARFSYISHPEGALSVTGIWGYHPQWAQAWRNSGDQVQDAPVSASASTLTVSDAIGGGLSPRFQVGQLLRIGEEYLHVTAIDADMQQLEVERGVQGTSASEHAQSSPILIYQFPADVAQLTLRWALWLYREPDSFAQHLPPILHASADGLRRVQVAS